MQSMKEHVFGELARLHDHMAQVLLIVANQSIESRFWPGSSCRRERYKVSSLPGSNSDEGSLL